MTSVDTNVLVPLLTGDHPRQTAAAQALFSSGPVWIAKTVLLETAWVLGARYGFANSTIVQAFQNLLGVDNVHVEDESAVAAALALTTQGIELADALHLGSRPPGSGFVSFDRAFIRRAQRAGADYVADLH